jgi:protein-S-isoprenylcysteine O-methyltransferase Ste14
MEERSAPMRFRRPLPPAILFSFLLLMVILHLAFPGPRVVTFPLTFIGLLPLLAGVVLNLAADKALKEAATTVKPFQESAALVTEGPFSMSRHPMYLGMVLGLLGVAIVMGTLTPLLLVPLFAVVVQWEFIRVEERMLDARFGEAWQAYKANVRPWI